MKKNVLNTGKSLLVLILVFFAVPGMLAQQGYQMHSRHFPGNDSLMRPHLIPNLTADQEKKIAELRTAHQKEMLGNRNDLAIKKAELEKYRTADKPDMALINKTIDEIGKLSTAMLKERVSHELAIRNLLTEDQRVAFDARRGCREPGDRGPADRGPGDRGHRL
jgi:Spy/CpxP family protein refolding chaperone